MPKLRPMLIACSRQPILADEVQTFKALITVHKVLQEGHPIVLKEAQSNTSWLESLSRGSSVGEGMRGVRSYHSPDVGWVCATRPSCICAGQRSPNDTWTTHAVGYFARTTGSVDGPDKGTPT